MPSFNLCVVSNFSSPATQYCASIHPDTCEKHTIDHKGYLTLMSVGRSMVVHYKTNMNIKRGSIAIAPTHASTLYVSHGDTIVGEEYVGMLLPTSLSVKLRKGGSIITNPSLKQPLYVSPGYHVVCNEGMAVVECGEGLYDHYNLENNTPQTINSITELQVSTPSININFTHMGIGGLKKQMTELIQQVLISRVISEEMRTKYEVKDIRGILLYGPPGTGKTLIARNIGKIIPKSLVSKINGPELSSKFYGDTEANIRKIFDAAKSNPDKLHVIIFDEIDAIGRKRGSGQSQIDDKVLTQLLTMIDGLDSANNILVIGITNRKDILDEALIRSGRLEYHIEIALPTEEGRKEILDIYLNSLRTKGLVDNIDSDHWAKLLEGYSGADIESLIGRAKNLSLLRNCDISDNTIKSNDITKVSAMTNDDLVAAFTTYQPTFSKNDNTVQRYITNYPLQKCEEMDILREEITLILSQPMMAPFIVIHFSENIVTEEHKVKACHLAYSLQVPYVRYVSYNDFLGKNASQNCNMLDAVYVNCLQAEKAVLILDSLADVGDRALNLRARYIMHTPLTKDKQLVIIVLGK